MVSHAANVLVRMCDKYLDTEAIKTIGGGIRTNQALLKQRWDKVFYTGSSLVGKVRINQGFTRTYATTRCVFAKPYGYLGA